ncbi:hypothetical protein MCHIJ_38920 [Mycolicibacterium chitae]|nr:hypothetical protein MCHIJ_38920 [Mycolicibacterium chitae]
MRVALDPESREQRDAVESRFAETVRGVARHGEDLAHAVIVGPGARSRLSSAAPAAAASRNVFRAAVESLTVRPVLGLGSERTLGPSGAVSVFADHFPVRGCV